MPCLARSCIQPKSHSLPPGAVWTCWAAGTCQHPKKQTRGRGAGLGASPSHPEHTSALAAVPLVVGAGGISWPPPSPRFYGTSKSTWCKKKKKKNQRIAAEMRGKRMISSEHQPARSKFSSRPGRCCRHCRHLPLSVLLDMEAQVSSRHPLAPLSPPRPLSGPTAAVPYQDGIT